MNQLLWYSIVGISFAPLVIVVYAVWKCSREQELRVELHRMEPHAYRLQVINQSPLLVRNLAVNVDAVPLREHSFAQRPARLETVLGPRAKTTCMLTIPSEHLQSAVLELHWTNNDDPEPRSIKTPLRRVMK